MLFAVIYPISIIFNFKFNLFRGGGGAFRFSFCFVLFVFFWFFIFQNWYWLMWFLMKHLSAFSILDTVVLFSVVEIANGASWQKKKKQKNKKEITKKNMWLLPTLLLMLQNVILFLFRAYVLIISQRIWQECFICEASEKRSANVIAHPYWAHNKIF